MKRHYFAATLCSAILASAFMSGTMVQAATTNEFKEIKKDDIRIEGKITALDTTAGTVTVEHKKKGPLTFTVPSTALLFAHHIKGHAALTDFKVGEVVRVAYQQSNGALVCESMWQPGSHPSEKEHKVEKQSGQ